MARVIRKSNTRLWQRLKAARQTLGSKELKVGWFSTARYKDGTPVAYVATIHEFGSLKQGIPARSFMRPTIDQESDKWARFVEQEAKKILEGTQTVGDLFETLGLNISGEIARTISEITTPPLLAATIKAKVRKMANKKTVGALDKPLVETGLLLDTVTHTVGPEGSGVGDE